MMKEKAMKIHICNDNKVFPFLYVDNWYSPTEEKLIWRELDFYTYRQDTSVFHRAEKTNVPGRRKDGISKTKAWRFYLDPIYARRDVSNIMRLQPLKMRSIKMKKAINQAGPSFRMFEMTNMDITQINYYEDEDHYESHVDNYMMTIFCWLHRKPKGYTGGDIIFTDTNVTVKCEHNRLVMFPSFYRHEVQPIKMNDKNSVIGAGRYCIVNFYVTKR